MSTGRIIALCGGVGGSRLACGLAGVLDPDCLTLVVNTADDFDHLGLRVCPDLDTVTYMLAGVVDEDRGWGRADETWHAMQVMGALGGETWFSLGDRDIALHLYRTDLLRHGMTLSQVTERIAAGLGVRHVPIPMSDDPVATVVHTEDGALKFQDYFVRLRCEPTVTHLSFAGAEEASISPELVRALADPDLAGIVIAPSNPLLSILPILSVPGISDALRQVTAPVVAVSPFVGGKVVKGPAGKLLGELGYPDGAAGVAACYGGLIDGFIVDASDGETKNFSEQIRVKTIDTLMRDEMSRRRVALACVDLLNELRNAG